MRSYIKKINEAAPNATIAEISKHLATGLFEVYKSSIILINSFYLGKSSHNLPYVDEKYFFLLFVEDSRKHNGRTTAHEQYYLLPR